jgi:uncharacterized BrkB/YihY/UPF0761 family membrane protein
MPLDLTNHGSLVVTNIVQREETYYLVTEDKINSVKSKSVFSDVLIALAALFWGAFLSVIVSITAIPPTNNISDPMNNVLTKLEVMKYGLLITGVILTILLIWIYFQAYKEVRNITSGNNGFIINNQGQLQMRDSSSAPTT